MEELVSRRRRSAKNALKIKRIGIYLLPIMYQSGNAANVIQGLQRYFRMAKNSAKAVMGNVNPQFQNVITLTKTYPGKYLFGSKLSTEDSK